MSQIKLGCLAALILIGGCQRDISGTYVARDNDTLVWLQLVRTPDSHVTGQLVATVLKPGGSIQRNSVSLIGAVNGENITLTGSGLFGLQTSSLSGTVNGDTITLAGAEAGTMILKRSSLDAYQAQVNILNARAQAVLNAKQSAETRQNIQRTNREFVQSVKSVVQRMQQFDRDADARLSVFPNVETSYQTITAKMSSYVQRERQLSSPNASGMRSQLSSAAYQATLATDRLHDQGESLKSSLDWNIKPIGEEATKLESACRSGPSLTVEQAEVDERNVVCGSLQTEAPKFQQKFGAVVKGIAHLEDVYTREKTTQDTLLKTAESLE